MMAYAYDIDITLLNNISVSNISPTDTIIHLLSLIYYHYANQIVKWNIFKNYENKTSILATSHGKPILKNIGRYTPFRGKLPLSHWQRNSDNVLNRLMLALGIYFHQHISQENIKQNIYEIVDLLYSLNTKLSQLTEDLANNAKNSIKRHTLQYKPIVNIAEALLTGIDTSKHGDTKISGFIVNMSQVFEKAVKKIP